MRLRSTLIVTALVVGAAVFTAGPAAAARPETCAQRLAAVDYWSEESLEASARGNRFLARIYASAASSAYLAYVNAGC